MIGYIVILMCFQYSASLPHVRPNTLLSYAIPDNRPLKKALGFNEDTYLNFTELTTKYGYSSEVHTVLTEDGYLLTIFRILTRCDIVRTPVILTHGVYDSSDSWILTGPRTGLAYILSNNCYDVWAVNLRGNTYSRKHIHLNPDKDPGYWEFSFDENGYYDLPAIIDYVLDITRHSNVYYIGHSQGTTDFLVMASLRPEYNNKIRLSILLAPVAWMEGMQVPIPRGIIQENRSIKNILEFIGLRELLAKHQITHTLAEFLCQIFPDDICGWVLTLTTGYVRGSITSKNLSIISSHLLVGVSVKTLAHFGQLIASGNFERYDEGDDGNLKRYGTLKPPQYNVSLITSPVVLVTAENDYLSTPRDVSILSSKLANLVENYIVPERTWSHNNHVWGVNATQYVFEKILNIFETFDT